MLIRVIFLIFLSYEVAGQIVETNASTEIDIYRGHPATQYFWATLNATENAFIEVWNLNNAQNVHSRKTLEDMWSSIDQTLKNPIGSKSLIRISNHFKKTWTHAVARDTLDKIFSAFHALLLRDSFKDIKEVYQQIEHKEDVNMKWFELAKLFLGAYKDINNSEKMKRNVAVIKTWMKQQIKNKLNPVTRAVSQFKKLNKRKKKVTK